MTQIGQDLFRLRGRLEILQEKTRLWEREGEKKPLALDSSASEKADAYTVPYDCGTTIGGRVQETVHIIRKGENLFRIGLKYGIPWEALARHNNLLYPGQIHVGQTLKIPLCGEEEKTLASTGKSGQMSLSGNIQRDVN